MPRDSMSVAVSQLIKWNLDEVAKLPASSVSWAWGDVVDRGPQGGGDVCASVATRLRDQDHIVRASEDGEWTVTRALDEYVAEKYDIELDAGAAVDSRQAELPIGTSPRRRRSSGRRLVADESPSPSRSSGRQAALDGGTVDKEGVRTRRWREMEAVVERDGPRRYGEAEADDAQLTLGESIDRWTVTVAASRRLQRRSGEAYPTPAA